MDQPLIPLAKAANALPGRPAAAVLYRWATRGVRVPGVGVVRLQVARRGKRLCTTTAWLAEFLTAAKQWDVLWQAAERSTRRVGAA